MHDMEKIRFEILHISPPNNMNCQISVWSKNSFVSQNETNIWRFSNDVKSASKIEGKHVQM